MQKVYSEDLPLTVETLLRLAKRSWILLNELLIMYDITIHRIVRELLWPVRARRGNAWKVVMHTNIQVSNFIPALSRSSLLRPTCLVVCLLTNYKRVCLLFSVLTYQGCRDPFKKNFLIFQVKIFTFQVKICKSIRSSYYFVTFIIAVYWIIFVYSLVIFLCSVVPPEYHFFKT